MLTVTKVRHLICMLEESGQTVAASALGKACSHGYWLFHSVFLLRPHCPLPLPVPISPTPPLSLSLSLSSPPLLSPPYFRSVSSPKTTPTIFLNAKLGLDLKRAGGLSRGPGRPQAQSDQDRKSGNGAARKRLIGKRTHCTVEKWKCVQITVCPGTFSDGRSYFLLRRFG